MPLHVRPVEVADAEALCAIYNPEVLHSTVTFDLRPRTLDEQVHWIEEHSGAYPCIVASEDNRVVGFASLSPWRPRPAYSTSVENSVYVSQDKRGMGVGRLLLTELVGLSDSIGFHATFARVVGGHQSSIALHRSTGFEIVGVEREVGRKFGRWLDVVLMERLHHGEPLDFSM